MLVGCYICRPKEIKMADHHHEPEQNEIGGPVVVAIASLALAVLIIYFL